MTRTVQRKPITQAMQLALWKRHGIVLCDVCRTICRDKTFVTRFPILFQWDHHLALVDGGAHDVENIRPICPGCHRRKSAREHKNNAKAKRLAAAREAHERGEKKASRMKSRGFDKTRSKKFDGTVVPRNAQPRAT